MVVWTCVGSLGGNSLGLGGNHSQRESVQNEGMSAHGEGFSCMHLWHDKSNCQQMFFRQTKVINKTKKSGALWVDRPCVIIIKQSLISQMPVVNHCKITLHTICRRTTGFYPNLLTKQWSSHWTCCDRSQSWTSKLCGNSLGHWILNKYVSLRVFCCKCGHVVKSSSSETMGEWML